MPSMDKEEILDDQHPLVLAHLAADRADWEALSDWLLAIDPSLYGQEILDLSLQVLYQGEFQDSWQVAKVLPLLGDRIIQPLLAILQNPALEPTAHWFAGKILGGTATELVVEAVMDLLDQQPTPELAEILLRILTDMGVPAIQQLSELLTNPSRRLSAVSTLAKIRHSQTIEPLISVVADPDPVLRVLSIEALSSFHDGRIPALLVAALADLNSRVRQVAVVGLGMRPDLLTELQLVDRLQPLLADLNLGVCIATATALGRMGTEDAAAILWQCYQQQTCPLELQQQIMRAFGSIDQPITVEYLEQVLRSANLEIALEALRAIDQLKNQHFAIGVLLQDYLERPPANNTARIRQEIAAVLGNMPNPFAVEIIVRLLADPDERVRWQAIYCLKQRGAEVFGYLEQLAQSPNTPVDLVAGIRQCFAHLQASSGIPES
jgi:HEAT repeat protein